MIRIKFVTIGISLATVALICAEEKPAVVTASLIPVGASSDARWLGEEASIRAVALDPGAAPPRNLLVRSNKGYVPVPTILNRPTPALPVREGLLRVAVGGEIDEEGNPPTFGVYEISGESDHYDIFLTRRSDRKDWTDAMSLVLPSSNRRFPENSIRVVNLCSVVVLLRLDESKVAIHPRRAAVHRVLGESDGRTIHVEAAHPEGEEWNIFLRTILKLPQGGRINLIVYPIRGSEEGCRATWFHQFNPDKLLADEVDQGTNQ